MISFFYFLLFFWGLIISGEEAIPAPKNSTGYSQGENATTLYLHHKPLDIKILKKDKDFLVPLKDLLNYLDLQWEEDKVNYHIFVPGILWTGKETDERTRKVMINGRAVTHGVFKSRGIVFVALNKFASSLGLAFIVNQETGIADLFKPKSFPDLKSVSGRAPQSGRESLQDREEPIKAGNAPSKKQETSDEEDPYRLEGFYYHEEINTHEVRAFATLRNISSHPLTGVVATAKYLNGNRIPLSPTKLKSATFPLELPKTLNFSG